MNPETEVILENDGTFVLQTDGGYAISLKTPVSAAWEAMRSIRGSDPDYGWKGNCSECRKDISSSEFLESHVAVSCNALQRVWIPMRPTERANASRKLFLEAFNALACVPVALMAACERGNVKEVEHSLCGLPDDVVEGFFKAANSMMLSGDVQLAVAQEFMARHTGTTKRDCKELRKEEIAL